jgi:steroid 5-alpha reductase family enzyme
MSMLSLLLWGLLGVVLLMFLLWLFQLRTRNAGIVDVGWAAGLGALGVFYAVAGSGSWQHRMLVGILSGFWGFRLAGHLLFDRVAGRPEEGRYVALRRRWGRRVNRNLFFFFQGQAVLAAILSLPFLLGVSPREGGLGVLPVIGAAVWLVGILGESLADRQLARFKADPANRGLVCREGLWKYSRHPNYFFEWIIWCGFALLGLDAHNGWLGLIGPVLILIFVLKITGIPPTEAQALKSRGDAYREYQRTTSAFVPWFPKRGGD